MGGWRVMEKARLAAKDLRSRHEDVVRKQPPVQAQVQGQPVIPHRDWIAHPYGDDENTGAGMAAATRRGLGNRTNQDAAALVTLPNGDRVALVVDGVFSYPDSQLAAIEFATAFRAELARTDRAGRTPEQALRDAHQAGLDALTMRYTPETGHGAVAYLAAYHGTDGQRHDQPRRHAPAPTSSRSPPGTTGAQLTVDDSRGGDVTDGGIMTRWAAGDYRPEPTVTTPASSGPGLLVLATDGLWRYLTTAGDLARALTETTPAGRSLITDPVEAAARLAEAARAAGGRDDLTVAVMTAGSPRIASALPRSGAIAVTVSDATPVALTGSERAAAEQAVRELHHTRPGAPLDAGGATYRRADPQGRWAAHGVRVYVLPGLRRRFDQLTRPGDRELALLYFVTEDHTGVRSVFVDPATLAAAERLPRSARALIAERELVRIVDPELPEPTVQAMPLPSTRHLRRLAARPYELGVAGPQANDLGDLIVEHLATTPGWLESPARLARRLGVDEDAVRAAAAAHPELVERFLVQAVLGDAVAAGFRRARRDGHPALRLTRAAPDADRELYIVGRHYGQDRRLGLDPLATAVHRLDDLRHLHRAHEPAQWRGVPTFQLVAAAWQAAGAPIVEISDLRVYRGAAAGSRLTLVTWRGELVNLHLDDVPAVSRPEPITEALASVVRITGQVGVFDATATGVVVAPEKVLTVAHAADVDSGTLRVDGLPVTAVETRRATEFGAYAELAARSVASAAEAGAPLPGGLVDLALLTVPGLGRPVARLRTTPVPVGAQLALAGHPAGQWLVGHGPVQAGGVHLTAAAPGLTGASGGPALDADGAVAGIQSYGNPSGPAHFIGPELIAAFLAAVLPGFAPPAPESVESAMVDRPLAGPEPGGSRASRHTADRRERRNTGLPSARAAGRFVIGWKAILAGTVAWASLEILVSVVPGLRGALPEPFDLFSHAKNLKGGAPIAVLALVLRRGVELRRSGTSYLTRRQLRAFHRYWVPGVMAVAAFVNALSETRWGLNLIGSRFFPETTPDPVDLIYSVVFAGAFAALGWRRDRSGGSDQEPAKDALAPALARAKAGLRAAVAGMGLSLLGRQAVHRELKRGLDHYWGRAGLERNVHVPVHLDPLAQALRERADRVGVQLSESESIELALRMLYWGTASAPYAGRHNEAVRRRAADVGAPVRDAVTAAFARLVPEPLRVELELDRRHLHEVRDALRGGPVAMVPMSDKKRREVIGRLRDALRGARPLSDAEFPNLARGPPEGVELVRIVEDDLGDGGSLIAFGWHDGTAAPDGVIVVPARVARVVEALIAADPAFAEWWARLLHHELDFHIDGDEHTGDRHDLHAAALAAEYEAQWRGRGTRDDVALRRGRVGEWGSGFLRELAAGSPEDALLAVLDAQGMGGTPTLVDAADWRELLAAGHQPVYRGINGERAEEQAEQFRSAERPFVGWAASLGGSGTNFSTDPATAVRFARIVTLPNPFRPLRREPPAEVVLFGHLQRDAVVLTAEEALERRAADVAAARLAGREELANLLADLGVWAALVGVDAVFENSGRFDRHYLVLNRGAMLVDTDGSAGASRFWSGDGWTDCACGEQHWGTYGAAGLLVVYRAPDGTAWLLMQHRSDANQHGGTWGLFGGARSLRETASRAAMREAWEEAGLTPSMYTVRHSYVDDHGNWSYTTVLAEADSLFPVSSLSGETSEVAWVRLDELATLPLHPGFAASWPAVSAALLRHTIERRGPPGTFRQGDEGSGPAGARKPPGSHMPEEDLAPALRGEEMTSERRHQLAAALSGEFRLPGETAGSRLLLDAESLLLDRTGRFGEWVQRRTRRSGPDRHGDPRRVLKTFVLITRRLLLDELRLRRLPIPPPLWRELDVPVEDPGLRPLAVDAGFRWEDGRLHLFVTDAEGAVHEVVESTLAGFAGFGKEVRHAVAVLAERAADLTADPDSWLTTRTLRDLDRLARENPAALDRLIADHERVLGVDIDVAFAGLPAWREMARSHVEQFREAAVARIPHRDVPKAVVDREAKEALRELRKLARELPGFTRADRWALREIRPYWNDEVYEGVIPQTATRMKRTAARLRLEITDSELLALAARRNIWGHLLGHMSAESTGFVEQVWVRLLPAGLREEFPLFGS